MRHFFRTHVSNLKNELSVRRKHLEWLEKNFSHMSTQIDNVSESSFSSFS